MTFRSDFPRLTVRILPVRTIQRAEGSELEPARVQFTPFLAVCIFCPCSIPLLLSRHITVLYTEATYIHCPIGNSADCKIQTGGNLCLHIFPTGRDVTAPCSGGITLQAGKARTGQQEYPLVVVHTALSVVDGIRVHQRIRIEIFRRRTQCRRPAQVLTVLQIRTVAYIRFAGIHPPGIDAQRIIVFVHLFPEQLACLGTVCVIEAVCVPFANPILQAILHRLAVHPALLVKLLEMFCCSIELRPDGNHHPPVHGMNRIDHRFRIREMCLVELMASPCVFRPVAPVEHNVVYRNFPVTETVSTHPAFHPATCNAPGSANSPSPI